MEKENVLPQGWEITNVFSIAKLIRGINYTKDVASNLPFKGSSPILRGNNINGGLNFDDLVYVPKCLIKDEQYIKKDDIVFAMSSGSKHLVGKSAVALKDFDGSYGAFCALLRLNETVNKKYISYIFKGNSYRKLISEIAKGTNINNLKREHILDFEIPLPPLSTQHLIVAKIEELFSKLDKGIENLKIAQQQLKTYRQSVLKWAFEGKLTNDNVKEGELPKGWSFVTITELVENYKHALKAGPFGSSLKKEFYVQKGYKIYGQEQVINDNAFYGDYYINKEKYQELSSCKIKPFDILISLVGTVGKVLLLPENCEEGIINPRLIKISLDRNIYLPRFFKYYFESSTVKIFYSGVTKGTTMDVLNLGIIKTIPFPLPKIEEQYLIIQEIESRLSVADKIEESITQSLQQAEALRQSILKQAFEGKLIIEKKPEIIKPKNIYIHQVQILGWIAKISKQKNISHGEMTTAKYAYLVDKAYGVPTYYDFKRGHLGPYPIEMKKAINNKEYFKIDKNIEVVNEEKLFKYNNPFKDQVINAVAELAVIFGRYEGKERAHKTELLATVCKVVEDIKSTDLTLVYQSMREWPIDLKTISCKNKAEKFTEEETQKCLAFIVARGWDKELIA